MLRTRLIAREVSKRRRGESNLREEINPTQDIAIDSWPAIQEKEIESVNEDIKTAWSLGNTLNKV
jgi:hypothetical protein